MDSALHGVQAQEGVQRLMLPVGEANRGIEHTDADAVLSIDSIHEHTQNELEEQRTGTTVYSVHKTPP